MIMKYYHIIVLFLHLHLISISNGEDKHSSTTSNIELKQASAGKTRGEQLAVETNSELISSSERVQQTSSVSNQCSRDGSTCMTCRSVGMCKNGVMTEVQCRGLYPYCDARTGSCTSEKRRCKEENKAMVCPTDGYYPDPQSCRAFHVCEGTPMASYKFACSSLQVYDHEEKKCSRPSFRVRCSSFSCFGKQGRYTPYSSDHSIYTLCADASATGLFKCPNNQDFDETKQKCVPSCTTEDNMPDTDDNTCRKYYKCVKSIRKIDAVPSLCPLQQVFDTVQLKCAPRTQTFKCDHLSQPIGSPQLTTTSPLPSPINEETYFRESSLDKTHENGKSASIIGSIHNKEVKETESQVKLTTPSNIGLKTNQDSVTQVLSQLSNSGGSHQPSKIVVRETMTSKLETDLTNTASIKTQSKPLTTEKSIATATDPSHIATSSSNEASRGQIKVPESKSVSTTTEKIIQSNSATTVLSGQTYKITTPEQHNSHVTTHAPSMQEHHSTQKLQTSTVPITKESELPSQVFHTKDSNDDLLDKIDTKQTKTNPDHSITQHLTHELPTVLQPSTQTVKSSTPANIDTHQYLI